MASDVTAQNYTGKQPDLHLHMLFNKTVETRDSGPEILSYILYPLFPLCVMYNIPEIL